MAVKTGPAWPTLASTALTMPSSIGTAELGRRRDAVLRRGSIPSSFRTTPPVSTSAGWCMHRGPAMPRRDSSSPPLESTLAKGIASPFPPTTSPVSDSARLARGRYARVDVFGGAPTEHVLPRPRDQVGQDRSFVRVHARARLGRDRNGNRVAAHQSKECLANLEEHGRPRAILRSGRSAVSAFRRAGSGCRRRRAPRPPEPFSSLGTVPEEERSGGEGMPVSADLSG